MSRHQNPARGWPAAVRSLRVDLDTPFALHWNGEQAFSSQLLNALSMSFPLGEQYFIDSLKAGANALPPPQRGAWQRRLAAFIGQEATHRHLHGAYNAVLAQQGLVNGWADRARRRVANRAHWPVERQVAITAAYEHVTAALALSLLRRPQWLQGAPQRLRLLWQWHSSEELEHRAVAFELLQALGVGRIRRIGWTLWVLAEFGFDLTRQLLSNLQRSGALGQWRTWRDAAGWMCGRDGVLRTATGPLLRALSPWHHPSKLGGDELAADWLQQQAAHLRVVSRP